MMNLVQYVFARVTYLVPLPQISSQHFQDSANSNINLCSCSTLVTLDQVTFLPAIIEYHWRCMKIVIDFFRPCIL